MALTTEQKQALIDKGLSQDQISRFSAGKKPQKDSFLRFAIRDIGVGATDKDIQRAKTGFGRFARSAFQSTIGSRGLAGVAQLPGRTIGEFGRLKTERELNETAAQLSNTQFNLIKEIRAEDDPERKARLQSAFRESQMSLNEIQGLASKFKERETTAKKAVGTTVNAALTAIAGVKPGSGIRGVAGKLPASTQAKVLPKLQGVRGVLAEQAGLGAIAGASEPLSRGEDPTVGGVLGSAAFAAAVPAFFEGVRRTPKFLLRKSEDLYQSALKPSTAKRAPDAQEVVRTGIREGIILSNSGIEKIAQKINDLDEATDLLIEQAAADNRMVKTSIVKDFVAPVKESIQNIPDIAQRNQIISKIDRLTDDFLEYYGSEIPVEQARQIKSAAYRELQKVYGFEASPIKEANKQLARGLKEGIIEAVDDESLREMGDQMRRLIQFDEALNKAKNRIKNNNIFGLGTKVLASRNDAIGTVFALLNELLGSAQSKTRAAVLLDRIGRNLDKMTPLERAGAYINSPVLRNIYERFTLTR